MFRAKCVAGRHATLLHGCGCQARETDYITNSVNVAYVGLIVLVDLDTSAFVRHDADVFQAQRRCRALTADGIQGFFRDDLLAAFQTGL